VLGKEGGAPACPGIDDGMSSVPTRSSTKSIMFLSCTRCSERDRAAAVIGVSCLGLVVCLVCKCANVLAGCVLGGEVKRWRCATGMSSGRKLELERSEELSLQLIVGSFG
jgi:hypothetical protein